MKTLTLTVCRRPDYTTQTMRAIKLCDGIEEYAVSVYLDPQCLETERIAREESLPGWEFVKAERPTGCNRAIYESLCIGFSRGDYHIHLEDDTVPSPDCLRWFEWASRFRNDASVFSVSAWNRCGGESSLAGRRQWFTPWGWATWRDRWDEMRERWSPHGAESWDVAVNTVFRGGRVELFPALSRVQNIGEHGGAHATPQVWRDAQRVDSWAGRDELTKEWSLETA